MNAVRDGSIEVLRSEPLRKHTSWRVGGPADLFYAPTTIAELKRVLTELRPLPFTGWDWARPSRARRRNPLRRDRGPASCRGSSIGARAPVASSRARLHAREALRALAPMAGRKSPAYRKRSAARFHEAAHSAAKPVSLESGTRSIASASYRAPRELSRSTIARGARSGRRMSRATFCLNTTPPARWTHQTCSRAACAQPLGTPSCGSVSQSARRLRRPPHRAGW